MFDDQRNKNFSIGIDPGQSSKISKPISHKKLTLTLLAVALTLTAAMLSYAVWRYALKAEKNIPIAKEPVREATTTLPGSYLPAIDNLSQATSSSGSASSAVFLSYGSLYKNESQPLENKTKPISLPMNVKTQTVNFYEIARKVPLDASIEPLNKNGQTVIPAYKKEMTDFYSAYQSLISDNVPQLLTSDFLLYDFENHLKGTYLDIKTQVFYKDIWSINRRLFDIANNRFLLSRKKNINTNDALTEAERLETAYYAVSLMLLRPRPQQINTSASLDKNLFSAKESKDFDFTLPDYLKDDVEKEIALILGSAKTSKSPVLLYSKNYQDFKIADQANSRLLNFSLATKWHNSVFPLYEKSENCPDCWLDENDWLINFITASLIASDFNSTEELRSTWARIYKVSSYFEGLRKELTYAQYLEALQEMEGRDFSLENIFSADKKITDKMAKAKALRDFISQKYSFDTLEGGYDRGSLETRHLIGMRMLQESYWPDDYIFSQLIRPVTGKYIGPARLPHEKMKYNVFTYCAPTVRDFQRCRPTSMDIINLIAPITSNDAFLENSKYEHYASSAARLSERINNFNNDSWHENIYWTILSAAKNNLFNADKLTAPINTNGVTWRERDENTASGAWVGLKTNIDKLELARNDEKGFSDSSAVEVYIEPNIKLIDDLLASANMVNAMLEKLSITTDDQYSSKKLAELIDNLTVIKKSLVIQMTNNRLSDYEQVDLANIISRFKVTGKNNKIIKYQFLNKGMTEYAGGVKMVISVYSSPTGNKLVAGPIFNHKESD